VHRSAGGQHLVRMAGELLSDAVAGVAELIAGELGHRPTRLTVDLSEVTNIDAAGADMLASAALLSSEHETLWHLVGIHGGDATRSLSTLRSVGP